MAPSKQTRSGSKGKSGKKEGKARTVKTTEPEFVVTIGPPRLTRFEKARIIGARSLQLAMGAPLFIPLPPNVVDPISLAIKEIDSHALPISIRRSLPNGVHQDIPLDHLLPKS